MTDAVPPRRRYASASSPSAAVAVSYPRSYRERAAAHGFVPALAFLPSRRDRWDDRRRGRWLAAYAAGHAEPFIDLTEPLRAAGFDRVYLADDPHWNAAGHQVVADALRPFLAGLVRARPARTRAR